MGKPYQNEIPLYGREYSEELNRISSKPVYIEVFFTKSEIIILIWRLYHAVLLICCPEKWPMSQVELCERNWCEEGWRIWKWWN